MPRSHLAPTLTLAMCVASLVTLFILVSVPACKTDDAGNTVPDWAVIDTELDLLVQDLGAAANQFPDHAEDYNKLASLLAEVDVAVEALEAGNVTPDAQGAVTAALVLLEQFPGEEWAFAAGVLLRRVQAYLPQAQEVPQ